MAEIDLSGFNANANAKPPPPNAPTLASRVTSMQVELDLPEQTVRDLLTVSGTNIVVIADDSSSMSAVSCTADVYNPKTRWQELRDTLNNLITMMLVVGNSGFNLKFLNDDRWYEIHSPSDLTNVFSTKPKPRGMTPLGSNLACVLNGYDRGAYPEGETIVLVLTDGRPSDTNFSNLTNQIKARKAGTYVSFVMCTEEDDVVNTYERCIDPLPGVDICDDYASEKKQCERVGNKMNMHMYLTKCLLGSKLNKYGHMDSHNLNEVVARGCCTVS